MMIAWMETISGPAHQQRGSDLNGYHHSGDKSPSVSFEHRCVERSDWLTILFPIPVGDHHSIRQILLLLRLRPDDRRLVRQAMPDRQSNRPARDSRLCRPGRIQAHA